MEFHLDEFKRARDLLHDIINPTPLQYSRTFGEMTGCMVYLKPECLQKNGSFKIRGAYTFLSSLSAEQKKRGVVTCNCHRARQSVSQTSSVL